MEDNAQEQNRKSGSPGNEENKQIPASSIPDMIVRGEASEPDLNTFIDLLIDHQKNCESEGKYVEAEIAKNRISELRQQQELKRVESIKSKHLSQKLEIEQTHLEEFNAFNKIWDDKMRDLEGKCKDQEEMMENKHKQEFDTRTEEFNKRTSANAKPTAEILNLKKIQDNLARQKDYAEAHRVQMKVQQLEGEEQARWTDERDQKRSFMQTQLMKKHGMERNAFQKKVQSQLDTLKKQRAVELERLLQKYQNIKKGIEVEQTLELKKVARKSQGSPSGSKYSPAKSSVVLKKGSMLASTKGMNQAKALGAGPMEVPASMPSGK